MKALALTIGHRDTGSTKYRVVQYERFLKEQGVALLYTKRSDIGAGTVRRAAQVDVLLNQKCLCNQVVAAGLVRAARRVLFDFDDAIYTREGHRRSLFTRLRVRARLRFWLRAADLVTPANEVLASYARRYTERVRVVPMALDLREWRPRDSRVAPAAGQATIGWAGAPVNLRNLERLDGMLREVLRRHPGVRLSVFSGERPRLRCPHEYHPFVPGGEADFTRTLDIGLLPLADEPHARGKSPIKAIQYLACGVPVVGDVIGATREIVTPACGLAVRRDAEWVDALSALVADPARAAALGGAGRRHVETHHDREVVGRALLAALRGEG